MVRILKTSRSKALFVLTLGKESLSLINRQDLQLNIGSIDIKELIELLERAHNGPRSINFDRITM